MLLLSASVHHEQPGGEHCEASVLSFEGIFMGRMPGVAQCGEDPSFVTHRYYRRAG